ncbi:unnamed protein product, partial [Heterosigma akashiwo]
RRGARGRGGAARLGAEGLRRHGHPQPRAVQDVQGGLRGPGEPAAVRAHRRGQDQRGHALHAQPPRPAPQGRRQRGPGRFQDRVRGAHEGAGAGGGAQLRQAARALRRHG